MIVNGAIFLLSYFFQNQLPDPSQIHPATLREPLQKPTPAAPFLKIFDTHIYEIEPKFEYELTGLVVSYRNFEESWLSRLKLKRDPFNTKDLCVLWGKNLITPDYKKYRYSSGEFTCYIKGRFSELFYEDALSNNHLLAGDPKLANEIMSARVGDQIHLKGLLVSYKNRTTGLSRGTSIIRTDRGNGACETIYVNDFNILKKANITWHLLNSASKTITFFAIIAWFYLIFIDPFFLGEPYEKETVTRGR